MATATRDTNLERWQKEQSLSPDWAKRARLASEWIPEGVTVLDIGCGKMDLEHFLTNCTYLPLDVVARDERTTVLDLNHAALPEKLLQRAEFATFLGVLEYLHRPEEVLAQLAQQGVTVVCSYQLANFNSPSIREKNGWFNAYRATDFMRLVQACGFRVEKSRFDDKQGLYLLVPAAPKHQPPREDSQSASPPRPKLVLSGFFGRGNAGDEALLQVQYEKLSPHFEIVISVDERGARDGFWNWYPYNQCRIIHHAEMAFFYAPDVVGLHVGGGDLPFGFNGGQVLAAQAAGKPVFLTGVDTGTPYHLAAQNNPQVLKNYLSAFEQISLRSRPSFEFSQAYAPRSHYGADWAFGLQTDAASDVPHGLTLVVIREFPTSEISPEYRHAIAELVHALEARQKPFAFVPFCPEDERFLDHLEAAWGQAREVHWWNPRRLKQYIAQASLVLSIGRLHPLIMAGMTGTPCAFAEMPARGKESKTVLKVQSLAQELTFPHFASITDMSHALRDGYLNQLAGARFDEVYASRFHEMVRQLTSTLQASARTSR